MTHIQSERYYHGLALINTVYVNVLGNSFNVTAQVLM